MVLRSMVGASVKRKEDPGLITGAGKYVGDIKLPGMQHVAFVRSPYAHAKIFDISTRRRLAAREGVTRRHHRRGYARSMGIVCRWPAAPKRKNFTAILRLSVERVRHVGEVVAAIIAVSAEVARRRRSTMSRSNGKNCRRPPICSARLTRAMRRPIFEGLDNNIIDTGEKKTDDVDAVFANAPNIH